MALLSLSPNGLSAQVLRGWGIKLGFTSSKLTMGLEGGLSVEEYRRRPGVVAVVHGEWFDYRSVSLVTEIGYVQRGVKQVVRDGVEFILPVSDSSTRFDCLATAVFLRVAPVRWSVEPYVLAGPRVDLLLSETTECAFRPCLDDVSGHKVATIGALVGFGVRHALASIDFLVEVRLSMDATDSIRGISGRQQNRAFDVLVGIAL